MPMLHRFHLFIVPPEVSCCLCFIWMGVGAEEERTPLPKGRITNKKRQINLVGKPKKKKSAFLEADTQRTPKNSLIYITWEDLSKGK